jgi:hypothetical protein
MGTKFSQDVMMAKFRLYIWGMIGRVEGKVRWYPAIDSVA